MFRTFLFTDVMNQRFPRVRGDVPSQKRRSMSWPPFSPRARGCSWGLGISESEAKGFPRVRGDVPAGFWVAAFGG